MDEIDVLLSMHGEQVYRDDGYWWKIEAWSVPPTEERPHGIRYNLTLHNKYNKRVFGHDNAHAVNHRKAKNLVVNVMNTIICINQQLTKVQLMNSLIVTHYFRISLRE